MENIEFDEFEFEFAEFIENFEDWPEDVLEIILRNLQFDVLEEIEYSLFGILEHISHKILYERVIITEDFEDLDRFQREIKCFSDEVDLNKFFITSDKENLCNDTPKFLGLEIKDDKIESLAKQAQNLILKSSWSKLTADQLTGLKNLYLLAHRTLCSELLENLPENLKFLLVDEFDCDCFDFSGFKTNLVGLKVENIDKKFDTLNKIIKLSNLKYLSVDSIYEDTTELLLHLEIPEQILKLSLGRFKIDNPNEILNLHNLSQVEFILCDFPFQLFENDNILPNLKKLHFRGYRSIESYHPRTDIDEQIKFPKNLDILTFFNPEYWLHEGVDLPPGLKQLRLINVNCPNNCLRLNVPDSLIGGIYYNGENVSNGYDLPEFDLEYHFEDDEENL